MRLSTALLGLAAAAAVAGVVVPLIQAVNPVLIPGADRLCGTLWIVVGHTLPASICAITGERGRWRPLMTAGIVGWGLSSIGWIGLVWMSPSLQTSAIEAMARFIAPVTIVSVLLSAVGLLMRERIASRMGRMARWTTIALATALAAGLVGAIMLNDESRRSEMALMKLLGVLAVAALAGTLVTLVASRARQLVGDGEEEELVRMNFTATCPRCELDQALITGGDRCRRCGLEIKVVVP
jgi:hypothetical protein